MAYYVRKIARAKWRLLEKGAENRIENYYADTIANDMRTQGNTLSLWRVESLSSQDIEPVIVINSLLGDTISKIDLLFIPEEFLNDFTLEQKDGNTVVWKYKNLHYDIVELSVQKHLLFAKDVVLKILTLEEQRSQSGEKKNQTLIMRVGEPRQLEMITKWIDQGDIDVHDLKIKQKEAIDKQRRKTNF